MFFESVNWASALIWIWIIVAFVILIAIMKNKKQ